MSFSAMPKLVLIAFVALVAVTPKSQAGCEELRIAALHRAKILHFTRQEMIKQNQLIEEAPSEEIKSEHESKLRTIQQERGDTIESIERLGARIADECPEE